MAARRMKGTILQLIFAFVALADPASGLASAHGHVLGQLVVTAVGVQLPLELRGQVFGRLLTNQGLDRRVVELVKTDTEQLFQARHPQPRRHDQPPRPRLVVDHYCDRAVSGCASGCGRHWPARTPSECRGRWLRWPRPACRTPQGARRCRPSRARWSAAEPAAPESPRAAPARWTPRVELARAPPAPRFAQRTAPERASSRTW